MKTYLFLIFLTITTLLSYSQEPNFQTYSADLLIIATKDGKDYQWENKNISVTLNYKTGAFKAVINNRDFYNKQTNTKIKEDSISVDSEFIITDIMPIEQIINQKTVNQVYDIELQLINRSINLSEMLNFKMNIMRTSQNPDSYRVFTLTGTLNNDQLNLPAFSGYDNEVEIRIIFNAFWNG